MADLDKFRTLAKNWEALGDIDPLFGVLSDPSKLGNKWDANEFFASGQAHVGKLWRTLIDVRAPFEPGRCLDFGCGVGRLTIPMAKSFRHTIGVDIAKPMVEAARRQAPRDGSCEFVVNRDPDLRQFADATFDVVHSCLVLQHIPPDISLRYVAEFLRVCRPGGLVVFQLPAVRWTEDELTRAHALPASAFAASLAFVSPPTTLEASAVTSVTVRAMNRGDVTWRPDIPAGRHLCVGNHWLDSAAAHVVVNDDGRALLPRLVEPGEVVEVALAVRAPEVPGDYILEADLVQEHIAWFSHKGSPTARTTVRVTGPVASAGVKVDQAIGARGEHEPERAPRLHASLRPLIKKIFHRLRGRTPTFEMHVVPRPRVEETIGRHGGTLIRAVSDNAAGPGWQSFTYVVRKQTTALESSDV